MNYKEALEIFQYSNSSEIEPNRLKNDMRTLAKKHHPDRKGDEEMFKKVMAAYELLDKVSASIKSFPEDTSKKESFVLELEQLCTLINTGKVVTVVNGQERVLTRIETRGRRVVVIIPYSVTMNGVRRDFHGAAVFKEKSEFYVDADFRGQPQLQGSLTVTVGDREITFTPTKEVSSVVMNCYNGAAKVEITVDRRVPQTD